MSYKDTAYEYAKAQGWTYQQVRGANYQQVAAACEIILGTNDESPMDFFYINIRRYVADRLEKEYRTELAETRRAAIRTKVLEYAEMLNATVEHVPEGETVEGPCWVVRRAE